MGFHEQINNTEQTLYFNNLIQVELVKRMYGDTAHVHAKKWIEENSKKFREVFEKKRVEDPDFLARCQTDLEKVVDEFEEEMGLLHEA